MVALVAVAVVVAAVAVVLVAVMEAAFSRGQTRAWYARVLLQQAQSVAGVQLGPCVCGPSSNCTRARGVERMTFAAATTAVGRSAPNWAGTLMVTPTSSYIKATIHSFTLSKRK